MAFATLMPYTELGVTCENLLVHSALDASATALIDNEDSEYDERCIVVTEMRVTDLLELRKVDRFIEKGCGCTLLKGKACSTAFTREHFQSIRNDCSSMDHHALNNILLVILWPPSD